MVQQYDQWLSGFQNQTLEVADISTAVYSAPSMTDERQTVLLIHGVSGNFYGLVPLAYELRNRFNIVLVDLPSHGRSQNLSEDIQEKLDVWSENLVGSLGEAGIRVDSVLAHSFGCYLAPRMGCQKTWLINPPAELRAFSVLYARLAYQTRAVIAPLYNLRWVERIRRWYMLPAQTGLVTQRLNWSLDKGVADKSQLLCQIAMMKEVLFQKRTFSSDYHAHGVVISRNDTVTKPTLGTLSTNKLLITDSGHLSPAESPEIIAKFIQDSGSC